VKNCGLGSPQDYQIGLTKVFFKAGKESIVEKKREEKISTIIVRIQAAAKGFLAQMQYKELEERSNAILMIQNNFRSYQKLSQWAWWTVISKSRPLIELWKEQEEKQRLQDAINDLKKQIEAENDKKKKLEEEKDTANNQITKLKVDLGTNKDKSNQLEDQINELKKKLNELAEKIDDTKIEKQNVISGKDNAKIEIKNASQKLKEKTEEMDGIKGNIGDSESAQRRLNEQIKQLITQKNTIRSKRKKISWRS